MLELFASEGRGSVGKHDTLKDESSTGVRPVVEIGLIFVRHGREDGSGEERVHLGVIVPLAGGSVRENHSGRRGEVGVSVWTDAHVEVGICSPQTD